MNSFSRNEIELDIKQGIIEKRFKNCGHLHSRQSGDFGVTKRFRTFCEHHSLEYPEENEVFVHNGTATDPRCPAHCVYFKDKTEAQHEAQAAEKKEKRQKRMQQFLTWAKAILSPIGAFFNWFAKLPATSQALLVIWLLLLFAPRYVPPLIQLIKQISGK
jgi:hypothetical protein